MTDDPLLTVEEVASYLKVHPETVRRMLRDGRLRGSLISKRLGWRIRQSALSELLDEHEDRVD